MSEEKDKRRSRIKHAVSKIAPSLAHALGGPLAGAAAEHISRAIFGGPDHDEGAIDAALARLTPEQGAALRRAELDFAAALRAASVEEARITADDRADARAREIARGDYTPAALGGLIIVGFFVVLAAMVTRRLPAGAETEFSIMLGALATMTAAVVNYFFGSSAGSKEKTRLMGLPPFSDHASTE